MLTMSLLKLTKMVTIEPYFSVVNNTSHHLRYMEENEQADLWLNIVPQEVPRRTLTLYYPTHPKTGSPGLVWQKIQEPLTSD